MSWVFQAITSRYDLSREMEENKTVIWLVTRYKDEIKRGDIVYFWQGGPQQIRGMYGWGVIVGNVTKFTEWGYGILVKYKKVFKHHISVAVFRKSALLQEHVLLRMPIGTNFKLSSNENMDIRNIIVNELGPEMAPEMRP